MAHSCLTLRPPVIGVRPLLHYSPDCIEGESLYGRIPHLPFRPSSIDSGPKMGPYPEYTKWALPLAGSAEEGSISESKHGPAILSRDTRVWSTWCTLVTAPSWTRNRCSVHRSQCSGKESLHWRILVARLEPKVLEYVHSYTTALTANGMQDSRTMFRFRK